MSRLLRTLGLGMAVLGVTATLAGGFPDFAALAQNSGAPAPSAPLSEVTVKALQEALNKQGIPVRQDGILNDETRAGIRKYQSQHHLPVTGEPDKATLDKLGVVDRRSGVPGGPPAAG